jgi:hypothetical protein
MKSQSSSSKGVSRNKSTVNKPIEHNYDLGQSQPKDFTPHHKLLRFRTSLFGNLIQGAPPRSKRRASIQVYHSPSTDRFRRADIHFSKHHMALLSMKLTLSAGWISFLKSASAPGIFYNGVSPIIANVFATGANVRRGRRAGHGECQRRRGGCQQRRERRRRQDEWNCSNASALSWKDNFRLAGARLETRIPHRIPSALSPEVVFWMIEAHDRLNSRQNGRDSGTRFRS